MQAQRGFTLIELLVVMAILVLLSVISYRALTNALDTRQMVDNYSEQLREFELGLFLLSKDFRQVQVAPLPPGTPAFISNFESKNEGDIFTLMRTADAAMLRGMLPVTYEFHDGTLWQRLDNTETDSPLRTPIISGIDSLSVSFDNAQGISSQTWQLPEPPDIITLTLQHRRYGKLVIKERINDL